MVYRKYFPNHTGSIYTCTAALNQLKLFVKVQQGYCSGIVCMINGQSLTDFHQPSLNCYITIFIMYNKKMLMTIAN